MSLFTKPATPNGGRGRGNFRYRGRWQRGRGWRPYGRGGRSSASPSSSVTSSQTSAAASNRVIQPTQSVLVRANDAATPYRGWSLYFPDEVYTEHSSTVKNVQIFEKYFLSWKEMFNFDEIREQRCFNLDIDTLSSDGSLSALPDLKELLKHRPESIINSLGLAMHQIVTNEAKKSNTPNHFLNGQQDDELPRLEARLLGYLPVTNLKHMKANYYGKFVTIKGTVVRVSNVKPLCRKMAFLCGACNNMQLQTLPDGKFVTPNRCPSSGCRGKSFYPQRGSRLTQLVDWQIIRVQELVTDDHRESGRIPRTVDVELTCDLVDSCVPGDVVTISGVVKVTGGESTSKANKDKCMFLLYVHANAIVNAKGKQGQKAKSNSAEFTERDMEAIREIQKEKNIFRFLVGSLCPTIYGHEMVKAGFVLALFGGSQLYSNDRNHVPVRGDPHVLVVGDPGLGKSQMLQAVSAIAPRSVYVCGNSTTTSGLTVTLTKDGTNGDCALEAGALVLADQGIACIDEFDKMGNQHQALLECMEQQSISIAKAGLVCSLPARTSIIAAANPVGGHYNKAKTVSENLRMGSALLSRFDLVFVMLDKPNADMDAMLSEHVMALHAGTSKVPALRLLTPNESTDGTQPLAHRLRLQRGEVFEPLPPQLFRKYITYAKRKVHPKIGTEAAKVLQNFYLCLRRNHQTKDSTPITTRQLESLIRLTEARARLELRDEATQSDAEDVVSIMKSSMLDTYTDEFGLLDFRRSQHGSGMSSKAQAKKLISLLQRVSERSCQSVFSMREMKELADGAGMTFRDFEGMVASLNDQGFLLMKGTRLYQLQTAGL